MKRIRVVVADDHTQLRSLIRARLEREPDFQVVAEAATRKQLLEAIPRSQPDILLIDPALQDGEGLLVLDAIARAYPRVKLAVLTAVADTDMRMQLEALGVHGIFNKGIQSEELIKALRQIGSRSSAHSQQPSSLKTEEQPPCSA